MRPSVVLIGVLFLIALTLFWSPEEKVFAIGERHMFEVVGDSMAPYGISSGDNVVVQFGTTPRIGDLIAFTCSLSLCEGNYIKELVDYRDGCYWIEGRRDQWYDEQGVLRVSQDSASEFGWLCGDDIEVIGLVEFADKVTLQ